MNGPTQTWSQEQKAIALSAIVEAGGNLHEAHRQLLALWGESPVVGSLWRWAHKDKAAGDAVEQFKKRDLAEAWYQVSMRAAQTLAKNGTLGKISPDVLYRTGGTATDKYLDLTEGRRENVINNNNALLVKLE